jgi:hypothetical protein
MVMWKNALGNDDYRRKGRLCNKARGQREKGSTERADHVRGHMEYSAGCRIERLIDDPLIGCIKIHRGQVI